MPSATYPPTQLGYGKPTEATIDQVNIWMRSTPWYQSQMRAWGQDPGHPTISKSQSQQLLRMAQAQGVKVNEGDMEVDDHGNFNPKGHKLRNTLIVIGIAAATIATMGAAGVFAGAGGAGGAAGSVGGAAGAAGTLASGTGLTGSSAITAAASTVGMTAAKDAVEKITKAGGAVTLENILKYALPIAGSVIGGVLQSNATGAAADAQQKYLEEALAYQKEQDRLDRERQTRLDTRQTGLDAQDQARWEAERATNIERYGANVSREAGRYGDFTGNIAPYLESGSNANQRMSAILGLPAPAAWTPTARAAAAAPPPSSAAPPPSSAPPPTITTQPLPRSPEDPAPAPAPTAPPIEPEPLPRAPEEPMVTMQAPDGSKKTVPASEVEHWKSKGALVIGQAA